MLHASFSRKGGLVRSAAKTLANRAKMKAFWRSVRAGKRPAPRRPKAPPPISEIVSRLRPLFKRYGVDKLEVFGSVARGQSRRGSDVDLIATLRKPLGLGFVKMADDWEQLLGVPVDITTDETLAQMKNPYRLKSINADRKIIYEAKP